ncbi:MAG: class I SAM-dependent RNA methyltransferase, partial [Proteobacteria bacterium]|nr:class I SAM-dependent RNA methyltransferase [Pseudomonadota bacterium]
YIFETYSNLKFAFGPRCFSQVTPEIANAIYDHARNIVEESKPKLLLDLYCGVGGFSLFTATHAERVIGIELSQEAIEAAKISAQLNNIRNASFYHADSNSFKNFVSGEQVEVIICNPPRRGIDKEIIEEIIKTNPREIIYSSCFIDTLARDLNLLSANYQITSLAPFEMFPLTKHLEIVAHLTKK